MELDRPHRPAPSTTSDLFICFTSRLSNSASMRLSSKSILSPGRTDKPPISLSTSLSRRLRSNNGSLKGGQSPMFPPGVSKKRGCAFENPEPSSPKVTCIGQVRVKTKKQGKKMKMNMRAYRARRNGGGGDVSFRRIEGSAQQSSQHLQQQQSQQEEEGCLQHRNQRWVHLPLSICDALRAFGSEFNCFVPCRSSCFSSSEERDKAGKGLGSNGQQPERENSSSSCGGAVFRWLVALHEGEGKTRDIELVVGGEEDRGVERVMERECSRRRSIFDDMDLNIDEICEAKNESVEKGEGEEEAARVSICIPPKNALLLMRCRSDPVKMSALASKLCVSPTKENEREDGEESDEECFHEVEDNVVIEEETEKRTSSVREHEKVEPFSNSAEDEEDQKRPEEGEEDVKEESPENTEPQLEGDLEERQDSALPEMCEQLIDEEEKQLRFSIDSQDGVQNLAIFFGDSDGEEEEQEEEGTEVAASGQSPAPPELAPSIEHQQGGEEEEEEKKEEDEKEDPVKIRQTVVGKDSAFEQTEDDDQQPPLEEEREENRENLEDNSTVEEVRQTTLETQYISEQQIPVSDQEKEKHFEKLREDDPMEEANDMKEREEPMLPDCLLLMMCEPKLSMEVSKETWVCSTDFIRWLPERHRQHQLKKINPTNGGDEVNKKKKKNRTTTESNPPLVPATAVAVQRHQPGFQPPRSSCSFPVVGGVSMASVMEKKLVNAVGYEPFALTRCKSEPMRSATAKFAAAPEVACLWKNRKIEPHRPATCGVGAAGVGF